MKKLFFIFLLSSSSIIAQTNTEIYVFNIVKTAIGYNLTNGENVSNNDGYDSQPYFYDNNQILFASNKNGNTEIVLKNIKTKASYIKSDTPNGGEYSPQRIPESSHISAVRLDNNGLQRFYKYDRKSRKSKKLIPNLKIAYPAWYNKNTVVASVIVNDSLELFVSNLKEKKSVSVAKMVGRSIHKIPNSNLMSFISKENKEYWLLKSLNPITKEIKVITSIGKAEDIAWLANGILLISDGNSIYQFHPKKDKSPKLFFSFNNENINNISRMTVNANGTKIAIVAEVSPRYLAQKQLDGYNNRDINAFLDAYAKDVKVFNFPNKLRYEGLETMRKRYEGFFKNTPDLHCKLLKRIIYEDQVIDHELVTANGNQFKAVAIYKMKNGKIVSVTFM
jgi:hypothetical protein